MVVPVEPQLSLSGAMVTRAVIRSTQPPLLVFILCGLPMLECGEPCLRATAFAHMRTPWTTESLTSSTSDARKPAPPSLQSPFSDLAL